MRKFGLVIVFLTLVMLVGQQAFAASSEPLKIGVLIPRSGTYTEPGHTIETGVGIALDEWGHKVAGRPIKVIFEDCEGKPATALAKAKKLVESDKVDFLLGPYSSASALVVRDYVDKMKVPQFIVGGGTTVLLSTTKKSPWVLRGSTVSGQYGTGMPTYMHKVKGYKKMVIFSQDYIYGWENSKVIAKEFEEAGGKVLQIIFTPMPTMDFAPYFSKINPEADLVMAEYSGAEAVRIVKQYKEFGLWKKWPLAGASITQDESLQPMGEAAVGIIGSLNYCFNLDTPENKKLVAASQRLFNEAPGSMTPVAYEMLKAIFIAIEELKGDLSDKKRFMDLVRKTNFVGPRGTFAFEESTNSAYNTVYVREVVRTPDGKQNTFKILKVIPMVPPSLPIQKLAGPPLTAIGGK